MACIVKWLAKSYKNTFLWVLYQSKNLEVDTNNFKSSKTVSSVETQQVFHMESSHFLWGHQLPGAGRGVGAHWDSTKLTPVKHNCLIPSTQDSKDVSFRQVTWIACFLLLAALSKTMSASRLVLLLTLFHQKKGFTLKIIWQEEWENKYLRSYSTLGSICTVVYFVAETKEIFFTIAITNHNSRMLFEDKPTCKSQNELWHIYNSIHKRHSAV